MGRFRWWNGVSILHCFSNCFITYLYLTNFYRIQHTEQIIHIAAGQGKRPIELLIVEPGARNSIEQMYIFTHTTVQDFLDVVNSGYNYVFEGEIINEIPSYYIMVTLGLRSGSIIKKCEREQEQCRDDDPDYVEHTNTLRVYRV